MTTTGPNKYADELGPKGLVFHNLGTWDITVQLWRLNDDGSRSVALAGCTAINEDVIQIEMADGVYAIKSPNPAAYHVVVTA